MVRQHDAAGTHADSRGAASEITDHDGGRRAGNARHVVMLGDPVPRVTKALRMLGQIQTLAQRLARCFTEDDRNEVENGQRNHTRFGAIRNSIQIIGSIGKGETGKGENEKSEGLSACRGQTNRDYQTAVGCVFCGYGAAM